MNNARPVVWTDVELVPEARSLLEQSADIRTPPTGRLDGIETADAAIVGSVFPGGDETFARAPRLQVVARVGIGFDQIDLDAATARGICIVNTPEAPTESTAEFAIALLLAVTRRVTAGAQALARGGWSQGPELIGRDLAGRALGLVGCGRIGRRVAAIATAFHMSVQAFDPFARDPLPGVRLARELPELLAGSDVVSIHVPLTRDTRHLLGAAEIASMKPGAILINTARGPIVDERALAQALRDGHLGGAGIDVWEQEPLPPGNPLLALPNVVATPHIAAFTVEGRRRSHVAATTQVLQTLGNERPLSLLNPEAWTHPLREARKVCFLNQ